MNSKEVSSLYFKTKIRYISTAMIVSKMSSLTTSFGGKAAYSSRISYEFYMLFFLDIVDIKRPLRNLATFL